MAKVAKVVVEVALDREFDYRIPPELASGVAIGTRVAVPFGRSTRTGYVVGLAETSPHRNLKPIESLHSDKPFITPKLLRLCRWMADYYCAPVEHAVRTALPGAVRRRGAGFRKRSHVRLVPDAAGADLTPKQAAVVALLRKREGAVPLAEVIRTLGITAAPVRALARKGAVVVESLTVSRDPLPARRILRSEPLSLMPEQAAALDEIRGCMAGSGKDGRAGSRVVLLYGVTGSGKTEVYLQAIAEALRQGLGAIVLVPEISLTPQTVERFVARFGDGVAVLHSHLSEGERHDEWHRIRDGEARIVIGARSAVFAPVRDPGLIVVDEEHEPSYKQEESPRYNARDLAVMRGKIEGCAVVLGSATPALESWHNAGCGKYRLSVLPRRADDRRMPHVRIVDMRIETERCGHVSVFSGDLIEAVRRRLERAEQTMLFLNRRGYATSLVCPCCGFVSTCGQCSVSFTYHRPDETLRCHICGGSHSVPPRCPGCGDPAFKFAGVGTQRVEAIVRKLFPQAGVQRMDADVTGAKDSYDRILGDFRVGKTDILIGTQMIAKGLHFPNVTLVGVVYADLSLHVPDFRAGERTFQLLAQVAGRAGRGDVAGEVIVQTYTPMNPAIQAARRVDYSGFCDQEVEFRRELSYPPFAHLVCITLRSRSEEKVSFCAQALADQVRGEVAPGVILSDPSPAPLARAKGYYRYQVMLRSRSVRAMTVPLRKTLAGMQWPDGVTCAVDVDALSLM